MADSPDPPPAPKYEELIPLQKQANIEQFDHAMNASRINSNTPNGRQYWTRDANGRWTHNVQLNPTQQRTYDMQQRLSQSSAQTAQGMLGRVQREYSQDADFARLLPQFQAQALPEYKGPSYDENTASKVTDALYNQHTRFLDPQFERRRNDQRNDLVAQGFATDSEAYSKADTKLSEQEEQAYGQARQAAISGGQDAAAKELQNALAASGADFNAQLAKGNFGNQQQAQAMQHGLMSIGQQERDRARALNELNAFRTGGQVNMPNQPMTASPPQALQGTDLLGATNAGWQGQLSQYNADAASAANTNNGLMGLAGTAMLAYAMM